MGNIVVFTWMSFSSYKNFQWEEKLKKETIKLRVELDQVNRDEKRLVLQSARLEKEAELQKAKEHWEHQLKELQNQVKSLKIIG